MADGVTKDGELSPGDVIADRYRIVSVLGRGAMGVVYRGEHLTVGRPVAVKVLASNWIDHAGISRRFRAEARAASAAGHPNIIEVLDAGDLDSGRPFLVTEFIDGQDLFDTLQDQGPLEPKRACRVMLGIARALEAAHGRGIIHRDLKPENVMLTRHGKQETVKVLDFGIAADTATARRPTALGQVLGTPMSMAPEQAKGERATPSFDIYALGTIAFEILSGRAPFHAHDAQELMELKLDSPAPSIKQFRPDLHDDLAALIDECLASAPADRPASATEVVQRLEQIDFELHRPVLHRANTATDVTLHVDPPTAAVEVALDQPTRRRPWALLIGVPLLLALGGVGAMWWMSQDSAPGTDGSAAPQDNEVARADPTPAPVSEPSPPPVQPPPSEEPPVVNPEAASDPPPTVSAPRRPKATATKKPAAQLPPPPASDPAPDTKTHSSLGCTRSRKQARQAREDHDWRGVLRYTSSRSCWSTAKTERLRLRTKALMELGRWDDCIATGKNLTGAEPEAWVRTCSHRRDRN